MFSYKAKNYALLTREGEVVIKGGALKSRGPAVVSPRAGFQSSGARSTMRRACLGRGIGEPRKAALAGQSMSSSEHALQALEVGLRFNFQQLAPMLLARVVPPLADRCDCVGHIFHLKFDESGRFDQAFVQTDRSKEEVTHRTAAGKDLIP